MFQKTLRDMNDANTDGKLNDKKKKSMKLLLTGQKFRTNKRRSVFSIHARKQESTEIYVEESLS